MRLSAWLLTTVFAACAAPGCAGWGATGLHGTMAVQRDRPRGSIRFGEYSATQMRAYAPKVGELELADRYFPAGAKRPIGFRFQFASKHHMADAGCLVGAQMVEQPDFEHPSAPDFAVACSCYTMTGPSSRRQSHAMLGDTSFMSTERIYLLTEVEGRWHIHPRHSNGYVGLVDPRGDGTVWLSNALDMAEKHDLACGAAGLLAYHSRAK